MWLGLIRVRVTCGPVGTCAAKIHVLQPVNVVQLAHVAQLVHVVRVMVSVKFTCGYG